MTTLSRNSLFSCLLLLTACAMQEQNPVVTQANSPPSVMTEKAAEYISVDAKPVIETRPTAAGKEKKNAPLQYKEELTAFPGRTLNKSEEGKVVYVPEMTRMHAGVMDSIYPAPVVSPSAMPYVYQPVPDREQYGVFEENPVRQVAESPVSTFSIDVDTGSYSNVRRMLNAGRLPPADAVRVEEMINYFPYAYTLPKGNAPFAVHTEMAPAPWNPNHQLLHIGIKAQDIAKASLPPSNLVLLVDVSGSMNSSDKLPLLKSALKLLVNQLRPQDSVSLVTYASGTQVVLEPTSGTHKAKITAALDNLSADGSTAGAAGITLAYIKTFVSKASYNTLHEM